MNADHNNGADSNIESGKGVEESGNAGIGAAIGAEPGKLMGEPRLPHK